MIIIARSRSRPVALIVCSMHANEDLSAEIRFSAWQPHPYQKSFASDDAVKGVTISVFGDSVLCKIKSKHLFRE